MKTIQEFRKQRDKQILSDFNSLYKEGTKRDYVHKILANKYKVGKTTIYEIIIRSKK